MVFVVECETSKIVEDLIRNDDTHSVSGGTVVTNPINYIVIQFVKVKCVEFQ